MAEFTVPHMAVVAPDTRRTEGSELRVVARQKVTPWEAVKLPSLRNFTIAMLVGVLSAGLAAVAVLSQSSTYESRMVVQVYHESIFTDPGPGAIIKLNSLRRKYAAIFPTQPIVVPTARTLDMAPGQVARAIELVVTADALVMYPSARARSAEQAKRIVDEATTQLIAYTADEQKNVKPEDRIELKVVQAARAGFKVAPTQARSIEVAAVAGILAVAVAYVLLQLATAGRRFGP